MTDPTCDTVSPLLVDYSDGRLPEAESARVAAHVAECLRCRSELASLERSLELARQLWEEAADRATLPVSEPLPSRGGPGRIRTVAVAAACVAALLLAIGGRLLWRGGSPDEVKPNQLAVSSESPGTSEEPLPSAIAPDEGVDDEMDVESLIARADRAARLAASAELLSSQPGLEQYRENTERYLAEAYRGTPAGDRAAGRVGTIPKKEPES
jgi:anti-sigma factor RsiW